MRNDTATAPLPLPVTSTTPPVPPGPAELPGRLGMVIQRLAHAGRVRAMRGDLTPSRLAILAILSASDPMPVKDVAARAGISVPTMSRAVELLAGFGWVQRQPHPADQRVCLVTISDSGRELLDAVRRDTTSRLAADIARLDQPDVSALEAALPVLEALAEYACA